MDFHLFRFGDFVLDPASRGLMHGDERVGIPPKSFERVEYLVRKQARAVGRDELISAVWGRADVSDALLAQTLLLARRAVGDTGNEQTTIRTVPRFGYQWVADVEECEREPEVVTAAVNVANGRAPVDIPIPARASGSASQTDAARNRFGFVLHIAFITFALAAVSLLGWWALRQQPITEAADGNLYVVAPVVLHDADPETAWVRLGVMDYIATRLREDGKLTVLPSQRVAALIGRDRTRDSGAALALSARSVAVGCGDRATYRPG